MGGGQVFETNEGRVADLLHGSSMSLCALPCPPHPQYHPEGQHAKGHEQSRFDPAPLLKRFDKRNAEKQHENSKHRISHVDQAYSAPIRLVARVIGIQDMAMG